MSPEEQIKLLCREHGYGFVMGVASRAWRDIEPESSIVTGPCAVFTEPCGCKIPGHCDKCYGCGWKFKKARDGGGK